MIPILLIIFALIASECYSNEVESSVNLIDLDEEALYSMIKELNFVDTLSVAQVHPLLSEIANEVFHDKKSSYHLKITGKSVFSQPMRDYDFTRLGAIHANNIPSALNILKHFGSSIEKITIANRFIKTPDRITISRFLRKYSSKSVKELGLLSIDQNILKVFTTPFKELEKLTISYSGQQPGTSKQWNKLFPNLKHLSFSLDFKSGFSLIDTDFSHLKHLTLSVYKDSWNITEHIDDLIEKNPTIESLELDSFYTSEFVKDVIQYLPNLVKLTLHTWNFGNDSSHFKNVKNLNVETGNAKSIDKLELPQLDSLKMHYLPDHTEKWTEFFSRHTHLTQLRMIESFTSHALPLNEFTEKLSDLVGVVLFYTTEISTENIIKFIDTHQKLQKFQFAHQILTTNFENHAKTLRERYEKDWNIKEFGYIGNKGLVFQRK